MTDDTSEESEGSEKHCKSRWRRAQKEALFSDWTIILTSIENEDRIEIFYVHKIYIGSLSDYFLTIFTMAARLEEHDTNTSRISLHDGQMDVFPFLLDYLYGVYDNLTPADIFETDDNSYSGIIGIGAVAILSLARYFSIDKLINFVQEYMSNVGRKAKCRELVSSWSKCEFVSLLLYDATFYSEDGMVKELLDICGEVYATGNYYERSTMMRCIPEKQKHKVVEHSEPYAQKNYDALIKTIMNFKGDVIKAVKEEYRESRGHYVISGAENISANGVYYRIAVDGKKPIYSKSSDQNRLSHAFALVNTKCDASGVQHWCIVSSLSSYLRDKKMAVYRTKCSSYFKTIPKNCNWRHGKENCLALKVIFKSDNENNPYGISKVC